MAVPPILASGPGSRSPSPAAPASSASRRSRLLEELGAEVSDDPLGRLRPARSGGAASRRFEGAEVVIHLAANVGGIGYNRRNPGPLAHDNLAMGLNVFEACQGARGREAGRRLLGLRLSQVHPRPLLGGRHLGRLPGGVERSLRAGEEDAARALATPTGASTASTRALPVMANLYGPGDNFDLEDSHVIAAMIHKYVVAAERGDPEVVLWGTGSRRASSSTSTTPPGRWFSAPSDSRSPIRSTSAPGRRRASAGSPRRSPSSPVSRGRPSGTTRSPTGSPSATST